MQVNLGELVLTVEKVDSVTILKWSGESNDFYPSETLVPFFNNLLKELDGPLVMQFQELKFMNSSTIHPLVLFMKGLNKKEIPTEIQYDKNSNWQRMSFKSMDMLLKMFTNIKLVEK